jgi:hypothetical protein
MDGMNEWEKVEEGRWVGEGGKSAGADGGRHQAKTAVMGGFFLEGEERGRREGGKEGWRYLNTCCGALRYVPLT